MSKGIGNENLNQQRQTIVSNPPTLNLSSELYAIVPEARISSTVAEIIAENFVNMLKAGNQLTLKILLLDNREATITYSLAGFTAGYDRLNSAVNS